MKFKRQIKPYRAAAGGWGSLEATTRFVLDSKAALKNMRNLMRMNKARGFDCPGCAWVMTIKVPSASARTAPKR